MPYVFYLFCLGYLLFIALLNKKHNTDSLGKTMLRKINIETVLNKKIPKKTQKLLYVSEILYYTFTKDLKLTPEQIQRKMEQNLRFAW